ncbi:poly-gamma-glutamate hydrolase family protein [Streptomyces sp. NPDC003038]|uniref:poly-gamma-glutamate hydrolase family protein n=1 Tax=unclassified Streptomyces TaxID=2593676 RepID=UPI0033B1DC6F
MRDMRGVRDVRGMRGVPGASRRTLLTGLVAAAAGAPVLSGLSAGTAYAGSANDKYPSNTAMYQEFLASPEETDGEGYDFARRYKRHEMTDLSKSEAHPYGLTTVLAIHGGGIEPGTSELCLGIAGYDPHPKPTAPDGSPVPFPRIMFPGEPVYDFWMFEGLRTKGTNPDGTPKPPNSELHVTSIHCDDPVAESMVAGSRNTVSLHGCTWDDAYPEATRPDLADRRGVIVGGRSEILRGALDRHLRGAGFQIFPGTTAVNGNDERNICNRTLHGAGGAQLELTRELRDSFFGDASSATRRGETRNADFSRFVKACRAAIAECESAQR